MGEVNIWLQDRGTLGSQTLWRWFGRFAIPIGDALSEVGGAIFTVFMNVILEMLFD